MLALGPDIGQLVDYIISVNKIDNDDEEQQQKLIDEIILESIETLHEATQNEIDEQYINYLCTSSLYSIEKKRTHLLNYEIDREKLRWGEVGKTMSYFFVENENNEFISYQKIHQNQKDILAFKIELDDDLRTKLENAQEKIKKFRDISECELLDLAIIDVIEKRYVESVNAPAKNEDAEDAEDFKNVEFQMFKNKRVIPISIYQRDHKVGNGIDNYMLALGTDLGAQVDYIIKQENLNYEEQQQLIDQIILDGIEIVHEVTVDQCEDYYEFINHASYRFRYKLNHFLKYEIDRYSLEMCDLQKRYCYNNTANKQIKSNVYQKLLIDQKDILAFKIDLDKDLHKKLENALKALYYYAKIDEIQLLELAIIDSIERRYIETLKAQNEYVEEDFDYALLTGYIFEN
jgi:hypothetical protein